MKAANATTQIVTNQIGCIAMVPQRPQRIISLVPSQTEPLFHLGLTLGRVLSEEEIVTAWQRAL
jgi:ABC-type Fe3+-hydroxamate transport system substrate-binding protein